MDERAVREALILASNIGEELQRMYHEQDAERKTKGEIGSQHRDRFENCIDNLVDAAMTALGS